MERAQIAISETFFSSFAKLPKQQQKKVMEFVTKFKLNPFSPGINLEKIQDSRSEGIRSARIDQTYRGILFKPQSGNMFMLLWVDHHDDAYDWAKRHNCEIHPSTGAIQIIDTQYIEQYSEPTPVTTSFDKAESSNDKYVPLFADYSRKQILDLGVPSSFLDQVLCLTGVEELEQLEYVLPADAWEPLYLLAAGSEYDELLSELQGEKLQEGEVDISDFGTALKRNTSKRKFVLIDDDAELEQMLSAPLDKWRVFLHPSQRYLVEKHWSGPVRVTGGAGTGKTVVAIHRAKWLAEQLPSNSNRKILFTTFTKNLVADIEVNLRKICSTDSLKKIEVVNIDKWIHQFLKRHNYSYQIVYEGDRKRKHCWKNALNQKDETLGLSDQFYEEEWRSIVQEQGINSAKEYARARRIGRGTALTRPERMKVWVVFEEFRNQLNYFNLKEISDAMLDAASIIENKEISMPYASVIVDESQDMGNQVFSLLRKIVTEGIDDMFIVGDGNQRIYNRKVVLSHCGIKVVGRSRKLKLNYRTTEETRRFASAVMQGTNADDLDDGLDSKGDYISLLHGEKPVIQHFENLDEERGALINNIKALVDEGVSPRDICIVARTETVKSSYLSAMESEGLQVYPVSRNGAEDISKPGIRVATMHRIKGLEFQYVMIVGVNEGQVPLVYASSNDPIEQRALDFSERALFHVASTRAIKQLFVSSHGAKSSYLL
ncbi:UvrD-helicase domain-containing protein [Vibrio ezurae]|uniref:DNA 3'-5' helicase n=1 Tax=Vibrio ezurae NBRC 102218 TaxID=1219080 RepID=U3CER3_9VIBR|nr:UvrD-helicase domain-containing protein [Vibrio ezurae]GAD79754.1 hypothetical protein VEZ01S_20_00260 [Vibrio ezurae NBRC 102218]